MTLEILDQLSPRITLMYKGHLCHTSLFSSVISIITYLLLLAISLFFIYKFLFESTPSSYFYNRHINDTGRFELNTSLFHFISFDGLEPFDNKTINIIGLSNVYSIDYEKDNNPEHYDHYIYSLCDYELLTKRQTELVGQVRGRNKKSYCISQMYNKTTKEFISVNDNRFISPWLNHGSSNALHEFYGIIIQKCVNNSINNNMCYDNNTIDSTVINQKTYSMFFIDKYVNLDDYRNPFFEFLEEVSSVLSIASFTTNNLNFYPILLRSNKGFVFDSIKEEKAFRYTVNEKISYATGDTGLLGGFYFWMQNREEVYNRSYQKLQELAACLGGVGKIIITIAHCINYFYHEYVIFNDFFMENVLFKKKAKVRRKSEMNSNISTSFLLDDKSKKSLYDKQKKFPIKVKEKISANRLYLPIQKFSSVSSTRKKGIPFFDVFLFQFTKRNNYILKTLSELRNKILSEERLCKMYWYFKRIKSKDLDKTIFLNHYSKKNPDIVHVAKGNG